MSPGPYRHVTASRSRTVKLRRRVFASMRWWPIGYWFVDTVSVEGDQLVVRQHKRSLDNFRPLRSTLTQTIAIADLRIHRNYPGWLTLDSNDRIKLPISEYRRSDQQALMSLLHELRDAK